MADSYDIPIGENGTPVRVPAWATEATARQMAKYNEATARALTDLLRQTARDKSIAMENQRLFKGMKKATETRVEKETDAAKERVKADNKYAKTIKETNNILIETGKDIMDVFSKDSLAAIVKSLVGLGALGAGIGFVVGQLETYATQIANLTNVGIGLGVSMAELRQQAAATGLAIEDYGNLVMSSGDTLRAIGENAQDGARRFSELSQEVFEASREFNNFGLTNAEYNEILMQEIELRRRSGMVQEEITDGLVDSFKDLMAETTAMAVMTGQDRREMLRRRQEMAQNASLEAARMAAVASGSEDFLDAIGAISDASGAGGDIGHRIGEAIMIAVSQGRDFRQIGDGLMASIGTLDTELGAAIHSIQEFVRANYQSMDPEELRLELTSRFAALSDVLDSSDFNRLGILAERGVNGAAEIIDLVAELNGLSSSVEENRQQYDMTIQQLQDTPLLALASEMQTAMNKLRASALNTAFGLLDLNEATENFDQALVDSIRNLGDNFGGDQTIMSGVTDLASDALRKFTEELNFAQQALVGLGAAIAGITALAVLPGTRVPTRRGLGALGRRIFGGSAAAGAGSGWLSRTLSGGRDAAVRGGSTVLGAARNNVFSRFLGNLLRFGGGGPATAIAAAATPTRAGDSTLDSEWQRENPFPEEGTIDEQRQWEEDRQAYLDSLRPATQEELMGEVEERRNQPGFFASLFDVDTTDQNRRISVSDNIPGMVNGATFGDEPGSVNVGMDASNAWRFRNSENEQNRREAETILRALRELVDEMRRLRRAVEDN